MIHIFTTGNLIGFAAGMLIAGLYFGAILGIWFASNGTPCKKAKKSTREGGYYGSKINHSS